MNPKLALPTTEPCDVSAPELGLVPGSAKSFVRMFKPQFAPLVEAGTKTQTVRPRPARMPKAGDRISLRTWTGLPYRSKQRVLREAEICRVESIVIADGAICVNDGPYLTVDECNAFAKADGFCSANGLWDWFLANHGLPFVGIVIHWQNTQVTNSGAQKS